MAKLCLAAFLFLSFPSWGANDSGWESALSLLEKGQAAEAIPLLETWLKNAEDKGMRVPEGHHALAVAYGRVEQWAPSVTHLLQSASLRTNPFYAWEAIGTLSRIQHRLMIQDAVSDHWPLRFRLLFSSSLLIVFASVGLWVFLFSFFFRNHRAILGSAGAVLLFAGLVALAVRTNLPSIAVVVERTPLFNEADPASEKLADLPGGAIVLFKQKSDPTTSIQAPFVGWISSQALQLID